MTRKQFIELIVKHNLTINHVRPTVGKFCQYEIGCGQAIASLSHFVRELKPIHTDVSIAVVNNTEHSEFGQAYVLVDSCAFSEGQVTLEELKKIELHAKTIKAFEYIKAEQESDDVFLGRLADFLSGQADTMSISGSKGDIHDVVDILRTASGEPDDDEIEEDDEE